jgi:hypothetical protein
VQVSPVWTQNDGLFEHVPLLQNFEQHSALPAHVLPDVRHSGLSGAQLPERQMPLQHSASPPHASLSDVH